MNAERSTPDHVIIDPPQQYCLNPFSVPFVMKVSQKLGLELMTSSCSQLDDNQLSCLPEALEELQQLQQLRLRCSQT